MPLTCCPSAILCPQLVPHDTAFFSNMRFPFFFFLTCLKLKIALGPPHLVQNDPTRWHPVQHSRVLGFVFRKFPSKHPFLFLPSFLLHWLCPFRFVSTSWSHISGTITFKDSFKVSVCLEITSNSPFLWQVHIHRDLYIWITSENHCERFLHRWLYLFTGSVELVGFQCHHDGVSCLLTLLLFWVWLCMCGCIPGCVCKCVYGQL